MARAFQCMYGLIVVVWLAATSGAAAQVLRQPIPDKLDIKGVVQQARGGNIVVLAVHSVPDYAHDWVTTPLALFEEYLKYLHDNRYHVVALRDLARYVNVPEALRLIQPAYQQLK